MIHLKLNYIDSEYIYIHNGQTRFCWIFMMYSYYTLPLVLYSNYTSTL